MSDWKQVGNRRMVLPLGRSTTIIQEAHLNTSQTTGYESVVCVLMAVWAAINGTGCLWATSAYSNYLCLVFLIPGGGGFAVQGCRFFVSKRLQ